ncbi:hypothetical protein G6011_07251 [Alternaria panax]|uniref:Uncharacterized protein n=1 Tax=Alternaria panax TaxID=48097 RepID=A0AAD4F9P9_9PLEO|nr:hypothetical protein G6011_07251 [Alternaria panax]
MPIMSPHVITAFQQYLRWDNDIKRHIDAKTRARTVSITRGSRAASIERQEQTMWRPSNNTTSDSYDMPSNPYLDYLYQGQYEYELPDNVKINANQQFGDYRALAAESSTQHDVTQETIGENPYHVPAYFDVSEAPADTYEQAKEEVKLEFDPPLRHYAELRGGLPIGYV